MRMSIFKVFAFLSILTNILAFSNNFKFRELIVRIHGISDAATVYLIEVEREFRTEFMKAETFIPVSIFSSSDELSGHGHSHTVIIVYQVPDDEEGHNSSRVLQSAIKHLRVRNFAIVSARNLDILHRTFLFFAKNNFRRIFGIIENTSSYAYMPFADNPVQELVDKSSRLPDAFKNLNGFAIRTTVQVDLPRAFWYPIGRGQKRIAGRFGQIFIQFLRKHNANFKEIQINASSRFDLEAVFNATLRHELDISMNSYIPHKDLDITYPVVVEDTVIMVPYNGFVKPSEYFLRPFSATVWMCIGLSLVLIAMGKFLFDSVIGPGEDLWSSFSFAYLTMLNQPTERPVTSSPLYYRFHLQVLLFAFIIGTLFGSRFQSYLTVYIDSKQFDTIQDLVDHNISVMISSFRWDRIKDDPVPQGLNQIIRPIHPDVFIPKLVTMRDTNFAYILEGDRCEFYIGLQSFYRKSLFRRARQPINSYLTGFVLPFHSPFKDILNDLIVEIWQTGLIQKWDSDVIYHARTANFLVNLYKHKDEDVDRCVPLDMHHLQFAWNCLVFGLVSASVVFVLECVYRSFKKHYG